MSLSKKILNVIERRVPVLIIGIATSIIGINYFGGFFIYAFFFITAMIGYLGAKQKDALINGLLFGWSFYFSFFMVTENKSSLIIYAPGLAFSIIGILLGIALAYIGYSLRVIIRGKRN